MWRPATGVLLERCRNDWCGEGKQDRSPGAAGRFEEPSSERPLAELSGAARSWPSIARAKIKRRFKVHDRRSHRASWMVMRARAGAHELMELGGWYLPASVKHYVALRPGYLRERLDLV
jgi:hypothetical protein